MNKKLSALGALVCTTALLTACGGGGGGTTVNANTGTGITANGGNISVAGGSNDVSSNGGVTQLASAEGVYEGSISNGRSTFSLVLENDQYFTIYGFTYNGLFLVQGLIQGSGTSSNGSFNSADLRDFYVGNPPVSGSLTASYTPAVRFNGSSTEAGTTVTFTSQALSLSNYAYNSAANLGNITGAWTLATLQGATVSLNIQADGTFSATSSGCSFSGTVTPRASGKNVFDVGITYGAAPCTLAGQSATGIAVEFVASSGKRQLIVAGTDATRSNATVLIGQR